VLDPCKKELEKTIPTIPKYSTLPKVIYGF